MDPWRSPAPGRPTGIPLPPGRLPIWHDGRPLKRWRYIGVYDAEVMLCVATARVGPARLAWWAVWDRGSRTLAEATHRRDAGIVVEAGHALVEEGPATIELHWEEGDGVETVSPHGASHIWTRKQGGVPIQAEVRLGDRRHSLDAFGVIDDSAGYHARHTAWVWSAGVGALADGRRVAWNLVDGVHDAPEASERTVWVEGVPHEVGPVSFDGLERVRFAEGGELAFAAEATRSARENLIVFSSDYEQPFGTFSGVLPGAGELAAGHGVMERHDVRW